jgi:hypothetical protein
MSANGFYETNYWFSLSLSGEFYLDDINTEFSSLFDRINTFGESGLKYYFTPFSDIWSFAMVLTVYTLFLATLWILIGGLPT